MTRPRKPANADPRERRHRAVTRALLVLWVTASVAPWTSAPAHATQNAPVLVRLAPGSPPAQSGQFYSGALEVLVTEGSLELARFALAGPGWSGVTFTDPGTVTLDTEGVLTIPFSGLPADANQPLTLSFGAAGRVEQHAIDVSGETERLAAPGLATSVPEGVVSSSAITMGLPSPQPDLLATNAWDYEPRSGESAAPSTPEAVATNISITGRFVYIRPDGKTVGADGLTVRAYQVLVGIDPVMASGTTDAQGYFTLNAPFIGSSPDLYVTFTSSNADVSVGSPSGSGPLSTPYKWGTPVSWNVPGSTLDLGWLSVADAKQMPVVHHVTIYTRVWRYLLTNMPYDMPQVGCFWPYGTSTDVPWYGGGFMHIPPSARQWAEQDLVHEYGHFWHDRFDVDAGGTYCNLPSYCDANYADKNCGHCTWCQESPSVAWNEGWSDWLSDVIPRGFVTLYGLAAFLPPDHETWQSCGATGNDAERTEGAFANVLRDIEDSEQDDSSNLNPWTDKLDVASTLIFEASRLDAPIGPIDFLQKFSARYPGVSREDLWEAAADNMFDELDLLPPGAPTGLASSSHTINVSSTDPTVDIHWTRATDDWSGVSGHSIQVATTPVLPDQTEDVGDVTAWTTTTLSPGAWYVSVRTRDRQGLWSAGSVSIGPFVIATAVPANLTWWTPLGWPRPAVPRPVADALPGAVGNPASLVGNSASTWANIAGRNAGTQPTPSGFFYRTRVDGEFVGAGFVSGAIAGGQVVTGINGGPLTVRGGRHVFGLRMDDLEAISEANELDNQWAHPWVWSPLTVGGVGTFTRAAPPDRDGGWDAVVDGSPLYHNSDGLRISSLLGWWNVLWIKPAAVGDDYDLRLHQPSTGPENGFAGWDASSTRIEGELDAVIVNRNVVSSPTSWDVGVVNWSGGASNYAAQQAVSSGMSIGDSLTIVMQADEQVVVREFYVGSLTTMLSARVDHDPADGKLALLWLRSDFTVGGMLDFDGYGETDPVTGSGRIDLFPGTTGWHSVIVYRDPQEANGQAVTFVLEVEPTPPNPEAYAAPGWHAPLVPHDGPDGSAVSVPAPTALTGDAAQTWINLALRNAGPAPLDAVHTEVRIDGIALMPWDTGGIAPFGTSFMNDAGPYTIPGGRHTLTWAVDPLGHLEETIETDNRAGEQWIWTPPEMSFATPVTRTSPPDPTGGWSEVTNLNGGLLYNCDGLRTPPFSLGAGFLGRWGAAAILPAGGDADLRLHETATGATDGFDAVLAHSGWLRDLTDFVLVNFNATPYRPFDLGIVRVAASPTVTAEVVPSSYLGTPAVDTYGPFTLGAGHLLHLYEVTLGPGAWNVTLESMSGGVDWGLTVHEPTPGYQGKSTPADSAIAFRQAAGLAESARIDVATSGNYAIAVWKVGLTDLPLAGSYRLHVTPSALVAVDSPRPGQTGISGVTPNPTPDGATVDFALHVATEVAIDVYDLRGTRVAGLARGPHTAGRHRATWDGRNTAGQRVAPGIYFVELNAGGIRQVRKLAVAR